MKNRIILLVVLVAAFCGAFALYSYFVNRKPYDPNKFVMGNGRVEATEVMISARDVGRIEKIFVAEGQLVTNGQKLVEMGMKGLLADLKKAKAALAEAQAALKESTAAAKEAGIMISVKEAEAEAAKGRVAEKKCLVRGAENKVRRFKSTQKGAVPVTDIEDAEATLQMYQATLLSAESAAKCAEVEVESAKSRLESAQSRLESAKAVVEAKKAAIERIEVDIDGCTLVAKHDGRIQYRIAQVGEMVGTGAGILNLVDLTEVYMTLFIPEKLVGNIAQGAECRILLDASKEYPIPANISYVSSIAQFTPKTVETEVEREKLMFRVRARIPAEYLKKYIEYARTGLPGVAYVKLDPKATWPEFLTVKDN